VTAVAERSTGRRHPLATRTRAPRLRALVAIVAPVMVALVAICALGVANVRNDSMEPTLHSGDLVVYDRWTAPSRGDIVLLVDREGWSGDADVLLVKRVVGVAGDVLVCCETGTGRLLVDGEPVDEPHVDDARPGGGIPFRVTVPERTVWVMGDNREASVDSRSTVSGPGHGGVALEDLRGVVRLAWER